MIRVSMILIVRIGGPVSIVGHELLTPASGAPMHKREIIFAVLGGDRI